MLYQWPKTFHKFCHDLLGSMIHQAYQDVTKMARIVIGWITTTTDRANLTTSVHVCARNRQKAEKAPEKAQIYYKRGVNRGM